MSSTCREAAEADGKPARSCVTLGQLTTVSVLAFFSVKSADRTHIPGLSPLQHCGTHP